MGKSGIGTCPAIGEVTDRDKLRDRRSGTGIGSGTGDVRDRGRLMDRRG